MIDLHTHTIFSDGELIPSELVRRAIVTGYTGIAITDHCDHTNVEQLIDAARKARYIESSYDITVIAGVEITHVPPEHIGPLARRAKELGAEIVVVHGETIAEPVAPGTNRAAAECKYVDIIAHPGFITEEEAVIAASNGVCLELSARRGHNMTNGHVAKVAAASGAKIVVDTDTHAPGDLISTDRALAVAMGAGLPRKEAQGALENSKDLLSKIVKSRL